MLTFSEAQIAQFVGQYLWPFFRIAALFMAMPIFGSQLVNARARLLLAFTFTLIIVPLLPPLPFYPLLSLQSLSVAITQVVIGLSLGILLQVVFQVFVLTGQFIAMKMGLGFASMNDPASGVSVTVVSQYYLMLVTMLFLATNGHHVVLEIMVDSFTSLPIDMAGFTRSDFWELAGMGTWLFRSALVLSLPVLTSLLVVNIAFGVMSRASPQMNVFAVGFPITLMFGLLLMWLSLPTFFPNYLQFTEEGFALMRSLLGQP